MDFKTIRSAGPAKDKFVFHRQVAAEDDGNFNVLEASIKNRRPEGSWTTVPGFLLPHVVTYVFDGAAQQVISV